MRVWGVRFERGRLVKIVFFKCCIQARSWVSLKGVRRHKNVYREIASADGARC